MIRDGMTVCNQCQWCNTGLLNVGDPGEPPHLLCHGCIKSELDRMASALSAPPLVGMASFVSWWESCGKKAFVPENETDPRIIGLIKDKFKGVWGPAFAAGAAHQKSHTVEWNTQHEHQVLVKDSAALIEIVEGIRNVRWRHDAERSDLAIRLKDTTEWVKFYNTFHTILHAKNP